MRGATLFALLAIVVFSRQGFGAVQSLREQMRVEKIQESTYVITDENFFSSNTLVAGMADGTVVIASSPYERIGTKVMMDWIKHELKPKKVVAINTHYHSDGIGGNEVFQKEGVETWSSKRTKELIETEFPKIKLAGLPYLASDELRNRVRTSKGLPAEHLFELDHGKVFEFGGEKVKVFFPGHAHSPDNLAVYFEGRKVLFGGCIVKPEGNLGWLRDANVSTWISATKRMLEVNPNVVVPGHGKWGGPDLLLKTIEVAKRQIREQQNASKSPDAK